MQRLIVIITGLHVLAHSLFGCCSHHSHKLGNTSPNSSESHCCAASSEQHCSKHCGKAKGTYYDRADVEVKVAEGAGFEVVSEPVSQHQCAHSVCHWVASKVSAPATHVMLERAPLFCAVSIPECFNADTERISEYAQQSNSSAPPLRLHLAVCVLLI